MSGAAASGATTAASARTRPRSATWLARRIHRWLGVVIGVQFVLWTVGGLYFSWTDLDAVHGDHLVSPPPRIAGDVALESPAAALAALRGRTRVDSLVSLELATVLGRPIYRLAFTADSAGRQVIRRHLADAVTGAPRPPLTRQEAVAVARDGYTGEAPVTGVEYLTAANVGRHHEYREQPLPAWAIRFGDAEGATVYVPSELGHVQRVRSNRWRRFDFLWMLHTMDFRGRDDFNNVVLRAFSVLGLVTVLSGFVLFALTSRSFRRRTAIGTP